jgi:hypothetical protein
LCVEVVAFVPSRIRRDLRFARSASNSGVLFWLSTVAGDDDDLSGENGLTVRTKQLNRISNATEAKQLKKQKGKA